MAIINAVSKPPVFRFALAMLAGALCMHLVWAFGVYKESRSGVPFQVVVLSMMNNNIEKLRSEKTPYAQAQLINSLIIFNSIRADPNSGFLQNELGKAIDSALASPEFNSKRYVIDHMNGNYLVDGHEISQKHIESVLERIDEFSLVHKFNRASAELVSKQSQNQFTNTWMSWFTSPIYNLFDKVTAPA